VTGIADATAIVTSAVRRANRARREPRERLLCSQEFAKIELLARIDRDRKEQGDRLPREIRTNAPKNDTPFGHARSLASKLGVSVVIPLYNEQDSLRELTAALREELFKLCGNSYEIIYINDGSTDRSAEILKRYSCRHIESFDADIPQQSRKI